MQILSLFKKIAKFSNYTISLLFYDNSICNSLFWKFKNFSLAANRVVVIGWMHLNNFYYFVNVVSFVDYAVVELAFLLLLGLFLSLQNTISNCRIDPHFLFLLLILICVIFIRILFLYSRKYYNPFVFCIATKKNTIIKNKLIITH